VQIVEKRKKQFFLFITHDIEDVLHLADRVRVMSNRAATIQESRRCRSFTSARSRFTWLPGKTRPHLPLEREMSRQSDSNRRRADCKSSIRSECNRSSRAPDSGQLVHQNFRHAPKVKMRELAFLRAQMRNTGNALHGSTYRT